MGISSPINSSIPAVFVITRDYVGIVATTAMSSPSAPAVAVHIDSVGECAFALVFCLVSLCSDYLAQPLISHRFGFLCIDRISLFPSLTFSSTSAATSDGTQDKLISNLRTIFFFVLLVPCAWLAVVGLYWLRRVRSNYHAAFPFQSAPVFVYSRLALHAIFQYTEMPRAAISRVETATICCHASASIQVPLVSLSNLFVPSCHQFFSSQYHFE
jgi:hypothetical protein